MDLNFKNKKFLIAGGSKGLGFGIAKALAQDGACLSISSRSLSNLKIAADELQKAGSPQVETFECESTDPKSIDHWIKASQSSFKTIDGFVVNTGGPSPGTFKDLNDEAWSQGFQLTLMSAVRMIRSIVPLMRDNKGGSIVVITSTSVKEPIQNLLLSNVMRAGVAALVKSLTRELASENIRINNLVPGRIDTDRVRELDSKKASMKGISIEEIQSIEEAQITLQRYGTTDEFGKVGAFLLSDAASYITGSTIVVDGGKIQSNW